jgi:hypothetical protein
MKVRCENRNCDWKGQWEDVLKAPHPFMPEETIRGCPGCNNIECLVAVYCTKCSAEISVCVPDVPDIQPEQLVDMWNTQQPVEDLSALVQRLVRHLRKAAPDDELSDKAMDYLRRNGRLGSPLRDEL